MPITRTVMVDDDGSGTTGTILNNAWLQTIYNQIDGAAGAWTDVAFDAANYTAAAGTWTVAAGFQSVLRYLVAPGPRIVFVTFSLGGNTTISASTAYLAITCPGMPAPLAASQSTFAYWIVSGLGVGVCSPTAPSIQLARDISGTPFPAQTSGITYLQGEVFYRY